MKALEGFDDLLTLGSLTREFKVGTHMFKMHTLNSAQYAKMTRAAGEDQKATTAERFENLQRWTLAYAVESIDGTPVVPEQINDMLTKAQLAVSNSLYDHYAEMVVEQNDLINDAKKNSSEAVAS